MSLFPTGTANRLCLVVLLMFAAPLLAQSEALGDVARQLRGERQRSGSHAKVWTNEDLSSSAAVTPAAPAGSGKDAGQPSTGSTAAESKSTDTKDAKEASGTNAAAQGKEAEAQKGPQDGNQPYLDKIAGLRTRIDSAHAEVSRLQRDQMESSIQFRSSSGAHVNATDYDAQQRQFHQQIEEQNRLIESLNQQLDDATEAARHAGVAHIAD